MLMAEQSETQKIYFGRAGQLLLGVLAIIWAAGFGLRWFDDSTVLIPDRSELILYAATLAAAIIAVVSGIIATQQFTGPPSRRIWASLALGLSGFVLSWLLVSEGVTLIMVRKDFPQASTETFQALLPVQRAFPIFARFSNGKWTIQPTAVFANIDITRADAQFILEHRRPGDAEQNSNGISSDGYFCVRVRMQRSGSALRVLDSGTYALPEGSIGICSEMIAKNPSLTVIRYL